MKREDLWRLNLFPIGKYDEDDFYNFTRCYAKDERGPFQI